MCKQNYAVEVQRVDGIWSCGLVWACLPAKFRELLQYINGENDPCNLQIVVKINGPPTRIRRVHDRLRADFSWPEDKKTG